MIICTQVHNCCRKFFSKREKPHKKTHTYHSKGISSGTETPQTNMSRREKTSIFGDDAINLPAPTKRSIHKRKPTGFVKQTDIEDDESDEFPDDESSDVIKNKWNSKGTAVYSATRQNKNNKKASFLKYVIFIPTEQEEKSKPNAYTELKKYDENSIITQASINSGKTLNSEMSADKSYKASNYQSSHPSSAQVKQFDRHSVLTQETINSTKSQNSELSATKSYQAPDTKFRQSDEKSIKSQASKHSKKAHNSEMSTAKPYPTQTPDHIELEEKSTKTLASTNSENSPNSDWSVVTFKEPKDKETTKASKSSLNTQNSERSQFKLNESKGKETTLASTNSMNAENLDKSAVKFDNSQVKESSDSSDYSTSEESDTTHKSKTSDTTYKSKTSDTTYKSKTSDTTQTGTSKTTNKGKFVHF